MTIAHFYHALDTEQGQRIYGEHKFLMDEAGFGPDLFEVTWVKPGEGFEDVTLRKLHAWAKGAEPDSKVLYGHTKGAFHPDPIQENWRRTMDSRLTGAWFPRLFELDAFDVVGLHWLDSGATNLQFGIVVVDPFFGGNFWWARADYLAVLPDLSVLAEETRFEAEGWVGKSNPRVKDLSPGWPTY
jgi:hypothetical protein